MIDDAPIFRDAGHALHVSFLIHSLPPTIKSPTAIVIDRLVKDNHVWDGLPVRCESSVNFSGLTPLEVRAQAAMVVGMVRNLPHPAERASCEAIYGHQKIKADGVRGMALYLSPLLATSGDYPLYVCWHVFMTARQREGVTQDDIARQFGVTLARVVTDCRAVRKFGLHLHNRALGALGERFVRGGLVPDEARHV